MSFFKKLTKEFEELKASFKDDKDEKEKKDEENEEKKEGQVGSQEGEHSSPFLTHQFA